MSVKFDKCPICGRPVWCEHSGYDAKPYVAICFGGHTVADLNSTYGLACVTEHQAARIWNKIVRKYAKDHPANDLTTTTQTTTVEDI